MKTFEINERIKVVCEWKKTRMAFKHTATLYVDDRKEDTTKICYVNRTWESYEFQSVLYKIIEKTKALTKDEKAMAHEFIEGHREEGAFKALQMVAAIGDILCDKVEDRNDWKAKMMKASLGEGISFPEDWNMLPEEEKARRLDESLKVLK